MSRQRRKPFAKKRSPKKPSAGKSLGKPSGRKTRTRQRAAGRLFGRLARPVRAMWRRMHRLWHSLWHRLWPRLRRGLVVLIRAARPVLLYLLLICLLTGMLALTVSGCMVQTVSGLILTDEQAAALAADQPFDCILILGAGLQDDGSPSRILEDRVLTGCQIFLSDPAGFEAILMSGDQTGEYNEVAAMQTLAVAEGVDSDRIWLDPKGYSTYESVYRAKQVYGVRRVLIVTQEYHLYRALYIAQSLGLEAYGVSADRRTYRGELWRQGREVLARYKDYFIAGRGKYAEEVSA